jgi:hypothetical protein
MIYMLRIYTLVAVPIFALAGTLILALAAWNEARQYALARRAMHRITSQVSRESFAISRKRSRNHQIHSARIV